MYAGCRRVERTVFHEATDTRMLLLWLSGVVLLSVCPVLLLFLLLLSSSIRNPRPAKQHVSCSSGDILVKSPRFLSRMPPHNHSLHVALTPHEVHFSFPKSVITAPFHNYNYYCRTSVYVCTCIALSQSILCLITPSTKLEKNMRDPHWGCGSVTPPPP